MIILTVLGINLFGDALRDAIGPKTEGVRFLDFRFCIRGTVLGGMNGCRRHGRGLRFGEVDMQDLR